MTQLFDPASQVQTTALALDCAVHALADAEHHGACDDEVIRLCDEVIARRLRLQLAELDAGCEAPFRIRRQMLRDRALLHQPASDRHV